MTTSTTPTSPTDRESAPPATLGLAPARFALTSGVLGLLANALFVVFWLITYPYWFDLTWGWLGPASDTIGIGMLLTMIPVVFGVRRLLPPSRPVTGFSLLVTLALASMALLQWLGTQGVLDWGCRCGS